MTGHLHPDESDPVRLWAEIHRLRAALQGPDGHATWQDAAIAERVRRVQAEKDAAEQVAAERERCIAAVEAVPTHRWVDGSDQWGRPCPAKIVATRTDYVAAIRGA